MSNSDWLIPLRFFKECWLLTGIDGRRGKATTAALVRDIPAVSGDEGKLDGGEEAESDLMDAEVGLVSSSSAVQKTPELRGAPVGRVLHRGRAPAGCLR